MDLKFLLKKTKEKSEKVKTNRSKVNVATEDRPYDVESNKKSMNSKIISEAKTIPINSQSDIKQKNADKNIHLNRKNSEPTNELQFEQQSNIYDISIKSNSFSAFNKGYARELLLFMYEECKRNKSVHTGALSCEHIKHGTKIIISTIKKTLQRLEKYGLIIRVSFKEGRGGWTQYKLADHIYDEIYQLEIKSNLRSQENNLIQTEVIPSEKIVNKEKEIKLPEEWTSIDYQELINSIREKNKATSQYFGLPQIKAIYKDASHRLTAQDVQASLNKFAQGYKCYGEKEPYSSMKNPVAVIVHHLKNGSKWEDDRILNSNEQIIFEEYKNISQNVQADIHKYFSIWLNENREQRYDYYHKQMRSTDYYDERIFEEKALDDYKKNIWQQEKVKIIKKIMDTLNDELILRFENIINLKG